MMPKQGFGYWKEFERVESHAQVVSEAERIKNVDKLVWKVYQEPAVTKMHLKIYFVLLKTGCRLAN